MQELNQNSGKDVKQVLVESLRTAINCWKPLGRVISDTKTLRHIWIQELRCWDGTDTAGRLHLRVQRYNLWRVENLEFWLRIVVALVLISQLFVPEQATKNQPIIHIRLEAVIISPDFIFTHFHHKVDNSHVLVESSWNVVERRDENTLRGLWRWTWHGARSSEMKCWFFEVLPASVYTTSFPSWAKEDLRWTAEHVSMLATKRPFFPRCYTVTG